MKQAELYFATNRTHEGDSKWSPERYGKDFSKDGHENLRFGRLNLEYDAKEANDCITHQFKDGRVGDGESLESVLGKKHAKIVKIEAYEDHTSEAKELIDFEKNSSTVFFRSLKEHMMVGVDIVIFIHGYSVSWEAAVASALSLEMMLNSKRSEGDKMVKVVLFSWPSDGSKLPWAYRSDRVDARDSGKAFGRAFLKLRDFLGTLKKNAESELERECGSKIHLLCHSMGNYVLQNAMKSKIIGYAGSGRVSRIFDQIFMCAPDVRDDAFEVEGLSRVHEMGNNVTIYFNKGDVAMHFAEQTKNFDDRLGHSGNARPALVHNKVHQVDCSRIVHGFVEHSYYQWATVNHDIQQSIIGVSFDDESRKRQREAQSREWRMT
jgi:esterase/lipase superfamily enzyme